jgi:hypothetical protein
MLKRHEPASEGAHKRANVTATVDRSVVTHRDCECGLDHAGNVAMFLDQRHFVPDRWSLDIDLGSELMFFRVIVHGIEQAEYGLARRHMVVSWWVDGARSVADLPQHLRPATRRRRITFLREPPRAAGF